MHLLLFLVQLSLALAIGAKASPTADAFRAIANNDKLNVEQKSAELLKLKQGQLECFNLIPESADLAGATTTAQDFKTFSLEVDKFEQFVDRCSPQWELFVERALEQSGLIGEAIRMWMKVLANHYGREGRSLESLFFSSNPRNSELKEHLLTSLDMPKEPEPDQDTRSRAEKHLDKVHRLAKEYLKRAYTFGDGICNQLDLRAPYGDFLARFGVLVSFGRHQAQDEPSFSFLGHKFGHKFMQPDSGGQFHPLALLYSVKLLCDKLKKHQFISMKSGPALPSPDESVAEQLKSLNGAIKWIWQQPIGQKFVWEDRFKLKQFSSLMQTLNSLHKVDGRLWQRWTEAVQFAADEAIAWSLRRLKIEGSMGWIESIEQAELGNQITSLLDVAAKQKSATSLESQLNIRRMQTLSQVDRLFLTKNNEMLLQSWLNGTGYCDTYIDPENHRFFAMFEMLETLSDLATIPGLTFGTSNRLTRFFFIWRICQQAKVLPIGPEHWQ